MFDCPICIKNKNIVHSFSGKDRFKDFELHITKYHIEYIGKTYSISKTKKTQKLSINIDVPKYPLEPITMSEGILNKQEKRIIIDIPKYSLKTFNINSKTIETND